MPIDTNNTLKSDKGLGIAGLRANQEYYLNQQRRAIEQSNVAKEAADNIESQISSHLKAKCVDHSGKTE